MRKHFKTYCSLLLAVLLVLSVLPIVPARFAAKAEDTEFVNGTEPMDDYEAPDADVDTSALPAAYDMRSENLLPAVRSQGGYGTCWSFGTFAAAESNLIKQGLADTGIDLSELHLVYYMYSPATDPLGNFDGDGSASRDGEKVGGGRTDYALNVLARWNGFVDEQLMPYSDAGLTENYTYPENYAYGYNEYTLNGYYAINLKKNPEALKKAIMETGAAAISYYADDDYMANGVSFYSGDVHENSTNHSVAIVGWDDNYDAANFGDAFNGYLRPANNGAWLIRNSWGTWNHDNGYFWMSYEEGSLEDAAFLVKAQAADAYDYNYQYDGGAYYYASAKTFGAANKFFAQHNETLDAVSVAFPNEANVKYSVDIYLNPAVDDVAMLIQEGTPEAYAHTEGETTYAGMYTIPLANSVALVPGDVFFVVIHAATEDGKAVSIAYDKSMPYSSWFESYTNYDDDVSYYIGSSGKLTEMEARGVARVKAFTSEVTDIPAPADFKAESVNNFLTKKAQLTWSAVDGAESYNVYMADGAADYVLLDTVADVAYSYTMTADNTGKVLSFKVAAVVDGTEGALTAARGVPNAKYSPGRADEVTLNYDPAELTVEQYMTAAIDYTADPEAASVYFKSSNEKVAVIVNGTSVKGVKPGTATLTAYSGTTKLDASLTLTVTQHVSHAYEPVAAKDATCVQTGWEAYEKCIYCGEANGEITYIPAAGHQPEETVSAVAATCTAVGSTAEIKCAVCGKVMSPVTEVAKLPHTLTLIPAVAPTCTTKGSSAYYQCTVCEAYFADDAAEETTTAEANTDVIPANGHELTEVPAKDATCVNSGNTAYYKCTVCGLLFTDAQGENETTAEAVRIAPTGEHTEKVTREAKAPTCTEDGWTRIVVCEVCNKVLEAGAPVKATGHDLYVAVEAVAPTCTEPGATARIECHNCDLYVKVSKEVAATGHTPYESKKAVEATCLIAGSTAEISCAVCHEVLTESEEIAKLEHTTVTTTTAPTCTEDGGTVTKCTKCGTVFENVVDPATGHKDEDENMVCDVCGELLYDESDPDAPSATDVTPETCKHMCHKRPEGLFGIIWKVVNVINRLMGINRYCACGAKHW